MYSTAPADWAPLRRLFNVKDMIVEQEQWYTSTHRRADSGVRIFQRSISPKVNIKAGPEFELPYL